MYCSLCGNALNNKEIIDDRHYKVTCSNCNSELFVTVSYYTGEPTVAKWSRNEWRKEDGRWILRPGHIRKTEQGSN